MELCHLEVRQSRFEVPRASAGGNRHLRGVTAVVPAAPVGAAVRERAFWVHYGVANVRGLQRKAVL